MKDKVYILTMRYTNEGATYEKSGPISHDLEDMAYRVRPEGQIYYNPDKLAEVDALQILIDEEITKAKRMIDFQQARFDALLGLAREKLIEAQV